MADVVALVPQEIPLPADTPLFTLRTQLSGLDFLLAFDYSAREDRFYLSVSDATDTLIVAGLKVVDNWDLLRRVSDTRRPRGHLVAFESLGLGPPGLRDIGPDRRVKLLYMPFITVTGNGIRVSSG